MQIVPLAMAHNAGFASPASLVCSILLSGTDVTMDNALPGLISGLMATAWSVTTLAQPALALVLMCAQIAYLGTI